MFARPGIGSFWGSMFRIETMGALGPGGDHVWGCLRGLGGGEGGFCGVKVGVRGFARAF